MATPEKTQKTPKVIVRNWFNTTPSPGESNTGELLVEPDQSYTIREILQKFTRGIVLPVAREPFYSDSEDFDDIDARSQVQDYADIPQIAEAIAQKRLRKGRKTDDLKDPQGDKEREALQVTEDQRVEAPKEP